MTELVVYRGLPASGKTTHAVAWVAEDPANRARVNRDDLRAMLHDGVYLGHDTESRVRVARDRMIRGLLAQGVSVACDDTNLRQSVARDLVRLARGAGADARVVDLTDVPLDVCIERDEERLQCYECGRGRGRVGEEVIRDMYQRFLKGRPTPLPSPLEDADPPPDVVPYNGTPGKPRAVMVDIDGTLAIADGRAWHDYTLVATDLPNRPVVEAAQALRSAGYRIVCCSGREDACRAQTQAWLTEHLGYYDELFMRSTGDHRKDAVVKRELFDAAIRDWYDVAFVLDDRQQVVDMWRELGLPVFQVAPGDF